MNIYVILENYNINMGRYKKLNVPIIYCNKPIEKKDIACI